MNEQNVQIIENATRDDVRPGDHVTWEWTREHGDMSVTNARSGIAYHRDADGDWWTKGGMFITDWNKEGPTLTIRRPITKES